ncbi:hypothetical protein KL918_000783 [Ogataea parapolymorpha]|uniref:Uncharacterized protein n=1 Tax=Ogataea parapolymorpha (strain ATCC 26012 / BCRC 20466 / JCM 22074 / NRRL Y-7560 / DL-1) TaxID=871575 RepID=W1Q9V8_OGAPD|nr:hypothetical protein HPODL_01278 [Ogataea parapolymorpha DL-1]ESW97174.1 hypothetical protein HPODL_01278 [Ogataea parapolymorpha DL-1]KAG7869238.1 hypothetical protein KL918_000783 [Ogataea parapolymorpha]KAG7875710.1 hypothetical protein KL916_000381 [Ogataea parapolymorpha]
MANVQSKELIKRYLTDSKEFPQLISRERFHSIVQLVCRNQLLDEEETKLYDTLSRQKQNILERVESSIDQLDLGRIDTDNNETTVQVEDLSLMQLIQSMDQLNQSLESRIEAIEQDVKVELEEINEQIDAFNDLRYGTINFETSIESLCTDLHQLENRLLELGK